MSRGPITSPSLETSIKKICTRCLVEQPLAHFYSKGNRHDSSCKTCVKAAKSAKYLASTDRADNKRLLSFFELIHAIEMKELDDYVIRLEKEIKKCQERSQR